MGVSVGLPVDHVWNGGSDLQAGVEMYSKKKCFSIALGHTLVVLEMH